MKHRPTTLAASLLILSICAWGQTAAPPAQPDSSPKTSGKNTNTPDASRKTPSDSDMVVVPQPIDPEAVIPPPKHVDPAMNDATRKIDRKNRKKSEDKKNRVSDAAIEIKIH